MLKSICIRFTCQFVIGEESVKELQRKRHLATPGVSFKGRVRKVAKWRAASDAESEGESESKFLGSGSDQRYWLRE